MGYTVELEASDLRCKSQEDAEAAAKVINDDESMNYHLQVEAVGPPDCAPSWYLAIIEYQSDHWNDEDAKRLWLRLAPHMADEATIELRGECDERWRVRWSGGLVFEDYVSKVEWTCNGVLKDCGEDDPELVAYERAGEHSQAVA
jgi:hypothetical protein